MSINVNTGPAALSYPAANGHTYWMGYASGHQSTEIPRRSADKAIQDAINLERENLEMTELQVTINNLKEAIIASDLVLQKLETTQKDLDKPKVPSFPSCFCTVKDECMDNLFVIGLKKPIVWPELPPNFIGRACFDRVEIKQIIAGLQTLLGESDD